MKKQKPHKNAPKYNKRKKPKVRLIRYEHPERIWFVTAKTANDRLWFVNNKPLECAILAWLAKYSQVYGALIYAFKLMGNHYHLVVRFPRANRAAFMKAFNSQLARLAKLHVPSYSGGQFIKPKYDSPAMGDSSDVFYWALYVWLNAVSTGLVEKLSEDNCYNSFEDASFQKETTHRLINWTKYNQQKRYNKSLKPSDFEEFYTLKYTPLPGLEDLTRREYRAKLAEALEQRRHEYIKKVKDSGKEFAGKTYLRSVKAGSRPKNVKTRSQGSPRALVLTNNPELRKLYLDEYFKIVAEYYRAVEEFINGDRSVEFPVYTYLTTGVLNY